MANAKPILYGVSDFVLMRTEGAYYIDRTAYIRGMVRGQAPNGTGTGPE